MSTTQYINTGVSFEEISFVEEGDVIVLEGWHFLVEKVTVDQKNQEMEIRMTVNDSDSSLAILAQGVTVIYTVRKNGNNSLVRY